MVTHPTYLHDMDQPSSCMMVSRAVCWFQESINATFPAEATGKSIKYSSMQRFDLLLLAETPFGQNVTSFVSARPKITCDEMEHLNK
jgi:hypothetical protein